MLQRINISGKLTKERKDFTITYLLNLFMRNFASKLCAIRLEGAGLTSQSRKQNTPINMSTISTRISATEV
ncbi:hypothetical protein T4B_9007 [Trichinella pseudospiralis]|uniref:Uncharacterized protein n=1 Tax=Trichinella pseudospiralis TaxID=6337 RepID=A0A0V1E7A1_TRIPS|nr:hypothetical protein T4A_4310 [Trichinella pseudospiralis]KRZ29230.1 hypothetical protein T4B_9007 [Trichinella pseudospiralis]KRZ45377.1 hypothetical protein T4C_5835 [Trichinella pseudospiralis]